MSAGDPGDFKGVQMGMVLGGDVLLTTEEGILRILNQEEEHCNSNAPTADKGKSKIQELSDEEAKKLQKQMDLKNKDGLKTNSDNWGDSSTYPWTQALSQTGEKGFPNKVDVTAFSVNTKMKESFEKRNPRNRNPMLLSPIIRCILKLLDFKDLKNCRLVCREWGSIGKLELASRSLIHFKNPNRFLVNFQSCFLDSTSKFSAFKISNIYFEESTTAKFVALIREFLCSIPFSIEELKKFFDTQQEHIKELTLEFLHPDKESLEKIDLSSWISKSPMVQKDTKHLTKLEIGGPGNNLDIRPLHLIAYIKDLSLSDCRIHVEEGIKLSPIKLKLSHATFYQDGAELSSVRINDVVDLDKTKEVSLRSRDSAKYVLGLRGGATLEKLILTGGGVDIANGKTSQSLWFIEQLVIFDMPYSLNSEMNIKELYLSQVGTVDLLYLPNSIQKLGLNSVNSQTTLLCSQPIALQNLQYLQILTEGTDSSDVSFLSHFLNCPQLTHLKLSTYSNVQLKSLWLPKSVKTLTLKVSEVNWLDEVDWNLGTLVVDHFSIAEEIFRNNVRVDNLVVYFGYKVNAAGLVHFLEERPRFDFYKRIFIGELKLDDKQFEDSVLKKHVDVESAFYVFQDGQKGRAVSKRDFLELIPKHLDQLFLKY